MNHGHYDFFYRSRKFSFAFSYNTGEYSITLGLYKRVVVTWVITILVKYIIDWTLGLFRYFWKMCVITCKARVNMLKMRFQPMPLYEVIVKMHVLSVHVQHAHFRRGDIGFSCCSFHKTGEY